MSTRRRLSILLGAIGAGPSPAVLSSCAPPEGAQGTLGADALLAWPAENRWPDAFWRAAPAVQEAYRFALANPQVLEYVPCFCGCGRSGHLSLKDCYVRGFRADGSVQLDAMGFA